MTELATFARDSRRILSVPGLLSRAVAISCVFLLCHMLGFREYTSFLCGMYPDVGSSAKLLALLGFIYVLFFIAFTMLVPVLLIAAGILTVWNRRHGDRQTEHEYGARLSQRCEVPDGLQPAACQPASLRMPMKRWQISLLRAAISALLLVAGVSYIPYLWCSRDAARWYDGDKELQTKLANGVAKWVNADLSRTSFSTGSKQFDGEWLFGTYMMAAVGFYQTASEHPELKQKHAELMGKCIERMLSPEVRQFDKESWDGEDPIESLGTNSNHAAYLGYFNIVLGLHRILAPDSKYADLNDRITEALTKRVQASQIMLIQSYPMEVYPVDNCAVISSIAIHARATGTDRSALLARWTAMCREKYIDPKSGLFFQAIHPLTGEPADDPRGSGTFLGLYFLSLADMPLARELYASAKNSLARRVLGFGGAGEYPVTVQGGIGDIDSGPVICGLGLSATGFMIAGSRACGDKEFFGRLYATAHAWGAPYQTEDTLNFVTGGPLGDAILFAMLTAGKGGAL